MYTAYVWVNSEWYPIATTQDPDLASELEAAGCCVMGW